MRTGKLLVLLIVLSISHFASARYIQSGGEYKWAGYADAKITFRVIDQDGQPVDGARVKGWVFNPKYKDETRVYQGQTDQNGVCVMNCETIFDLEYRIEKDGYYCTRGEYDFSLGRFVLV